MPVRQRNPNEIAQQVMPLLLLGVALLGSNRYFTVQAQEARGFDAAAQPLQTILAALGPGAEPLGHPPLYELLIHFWLRWTGGSFETLRLPAILLFLGELFLLGRAARRLGGSANALAVVWTAVLWPFGFLHGRISGRHSLAFFLVGLLTFLYLRCVEAPSARRWAGFVLAGCALLWTSYFAWPILACLALDQFFRHRASQRGIRPAMLAMAAAAFLASSVPLLGGLRAEGSELLGLPHRAGSFFAAAGINVYSLFVGEAVAPWYLPLSFPAAVAVLACVGLVWVSNSWAARRFLLYGAGIATLAAASGVPAGDGLLCAAPWFVLPIGVAIGTSTNQRTRIGLTLALLLVGVIGWLGIYSRTHYFDPRFIEPWQQTADDAAGKIEGGATAIANHPSFFFYLTYAFRLSAGTSWTFTGSLPDSVRQPRIVSPEQWLAAGRPLSPAMLLVEGVDGAGLQDAQEYLDRTCGGRSSRRMMRDEHFQWKQRLFPAWRASQWRIEVREYDCSSAASPGILYFPR